MKMNREQFKKRIDALGKKFARVRAHALTYCINQEDLLDMSCLSVVARQHALLVGPWGCNKTRTINVFSHFIGATNGQMFRCTLDKTTPPEALLGPISPKQLLEQDRFVRNLQGTVCDATYAFIGEAFSGNSATRRALHTVLNERYVENGGERVTIPLHTAFLDSNELPTRREDRPFYDRIVLRAEVGYIDAGDKDAFIKMRRSPQFVPSKVDPIMSLAEVREAAAIARQITVPHVIDESMHTLRSNMYAKGITLSDRRWYNAYSVLRASALLDGRDHVEPGDLWALRFVLVDIVDGQARAVVDELKPYKGQSLKAAEQTFVRDAQMLFSQAQQGNQEFRRQTAESIRAFVDNVIDADVKAEIEKIADELDNIIEKEEAANVAGLLVGDANDYESDDVTDSVLDDLIGLGKGNAKSDDTDEEVADELEDDEEKEEDEDEEEEDAYA